MGYVWQLVAQHSYVTPSVLAPSSAPCVAVYFKLFDMIVIQTILVGMVLTDGQAIRGERDGAAHLFYGVLSVSD